MLCQSTTCRCYPDRGGDVCQQMCQADGRVLAHQLPEGCVIARVPAAGETPHQLGTGHLGADEKLRLQDLVEPCQPVAVNDLLHLQANGSE